MKATRETLHSYYYSLNKLSAKLCLEADVPSHSRSQYASSLQLTVPRTCPSATDNHAFLMAATRVWSSLPPDLLVLNSCDENGYLAFS